MGGGGEELEQANLQKFKFPGGCLWDESFELIDAFYTQFIRVVLNHS